MATKRQNVLVIGLSAIIALAIILTRRQCSRPHRITSEVHKVVNGWGYDILVDNKLLIRQESIPVIAAQRPFATKDQAEKTARLVIQKLEAGQSPSLTKFDLETILPVYVLENAR